MKKGQILMSGIVLLTVAVTMTSCVEFRRGQTLFGTASITEQRGLKGFEEIEINGSPTVYYTQSDHFSVKLKGSESQVKDILTEMDGKTLVIRNKRKFGIFNVQLGDDDDVAVYVTSPDITSIRLNGSGDFISHERIDTDNMDMDVSRLEAQEVSGLLIGSGDLDLGLLKVDDTSLSLKGSGDIDADFREGCGSVDCELRGSGDITLKGTVRRFNQHTTGSGSVDIDKLSIQQ